MTESAMHQKLKMQAKQLLIEKGFAEEKIIIDKKWIEVDLHGRKKKFRIDVYASNGHEMAIECGNFSDLKLPYYEKYFGSENIIHLRYPAEWRNRYRSKEVKEDNLTKAQATQYLIDTYKEFVYSEFKDDSTFDFQEFTEATRETFDADSHRTYREINPDWTDEKEVKGKDIWMNFPDSKTISKHQFKNEIHWGMLYYGSGFFAVTVIFSGREACEKFLNQSLDSHKKIFEALKRLPPNFRIRDGFSFWEKSTMPPLDKHWNDAIPCCELEWEDYEEILSNLELAIEHQKLGFKVGPILDLAKAFGKQEDLPIIIDSLKELYTLLLKSETKTDVVARNIKTLPDWVWYLSEPSQRKFLRQEYEKQYGELSDGDFKKACGKLKFDPEYTGIK